MNSIYRGNGGGGLDPTAPEGEHEPETYICRLESAPAVKDYLRNGLCVRFSGITQPDLKLLRESPQVSVFNLDIDLWDLARRLPSLRDVTADSLEPLLRLENEGYVEDGNFPWYSLNLRKDAEGRSYAYRHFSDERATRYSLQTISTPKENGVPTQPDTVLIPGEQELLGLVSEFGDTGRRYEFRAYHVGQGMCSLVDNGEIGFLLDAGAGVPITRKGYLSGAVVNHLLGRVSGLKKLIFVLSHPDSDHWRLLSWDTTLLAKVELALVPKGLPALPFFDDAIRARVRHVGDLSIRLGGGQYLTLFRCQPAKLDRNGDGLIALFSDGQGTRILAPGDYVYKRILSDKNPKVKALMSQPFSGLQVPHHGDSESALNVPTSTGGNAKAFFSAGNHKGYHHPTPESGASHEPDFALLNFKNGDSTEIKDELL